MKIKIEEIENKKKKIIKVKKLVIFYMVMNY